MKSLTQYRELPPVVAFRTHLAESTSHGFSSGYACMVASFAQWLAEEAQIELIDTELESDVWKRCLQGDASALRSRDAVSALLLMSDDRSIARYLVAQKSRYVMTGLKERSLCLIRFHRWIRARKIACRGRLEKLPRVQWRVSQYGRQLAELASG